MKKAESALDNFEQGYNCAQAVLMVFGPELGLTSELCQALAAPFGGGMAREGEVCGALAGGLMALGLRFGRGIGTPTERKELVYGKAQELFARFRTRHPTLLCRELLGCNLKTAEGKRLSKERDLHHTVCALLVEEIVTCLDESP
jgi:C_GCAxxG_C_C family probable redox protein